MPSIVAGLAALTHVGGVVHSGTEPDPSPPPSVDLVPAELALLLSPLILRSTPVADWVANVENNLDGYCTKLKLEVALGLGSNEYTYLTDTANPDNPHYGPLQTVYARNLRAGKAVDSSDPDMAAALAITEECVQLMHWSGGILHAQIASQYTNWPDLEILYRLYSADPPSTSPVSSNVTGDTNTIASHARSALHLGANWLSYHIKNDTTVVTHQWIDERITALALELAMAADRVGITFGTTIGGFGINQIGAAGSDSPFSSNPTSWSDYIEHINDEFIDVLQADTVSRFGTGNDPNGVPMRDGTIRCYSSCEYGPFTSPYPFLPFMTGMLMNALLRAYRQYGSTTSLANMLALSVGVRDHFHATRHCWPYQSHKPSGGTGFSGDDQDFIRNNYMVRPLYEAGPYPGGGAWMATMAVEAIAATGAVWPLPPSGGSEPTWNPWTYTLKQGQQLGGATQPQSVHALMAGLTPA